MSALQQNWARFLTQMKCRSHFPRSVGTAASLMSCVYIVTGAVGSVTRPLVHEEAKALVPQACIVAAQDYSLAYDRVVEERPGKQSVSSSCLAVA